MTDEIKTAQTNVDDQLQREREIYRRLLETNPGPIGGFFDSLDEETRKVFIDHLQKCVTNNPQTPEHIYTQLEKEISSWHESDQDSHTNNMRDTMKSLIDELRENQDKLFGEKIYQNIESIMDLNEKLTTSLTNEINKNDAYNITKQDFKDKISAMPGLDFCQFIVKHAGNSNRVKLATEDLTKHLETVAKNLLPEEHPARNKKILNANNVSDFCKKQLQDTKNNFAKSLLTDTERRAINSPLRNLLNDMQSAYKAIYPHAKTLVGSVIQVGKISLKTAGMIVLTPILLAYEAIKITAQATKSIAVRTYGAVKDIKKSKDFKQSLKEHGQAAGGEIKQSVKKAASNFAQNVKGVYNNPIDTAKNAASAAGTATKNAASAVGTAVKQGASAVGTAVKQGASAVGNATKNVLKRKVTQDTTPNNPKTPTSTNIGQQTDRSLS